MSIYRNDHHLWQPMLRRAFIVTAAILLLTAPMAAQRFSQTIGGTSPAVVSGDAIVEAANGDLVVAGTAGWDASSTETYVVRTGADGVVQWQHRIAFWGGFNSDAKDIKEYDNGDFIVVGTIYFENAARAYAIRLTSAGDRVWAAMFGGQYDRSTAEGVVIAEYGSGAAQPGDIIVAGSTYTDNARDGLLARINGNGNLIWFKSYDIPGGTINGLYDIDEARIRSAQGTIGDIVAVGESRGVPQGNLTDVWVLRVNGNTGDIGGAPYGSALFGSLKDDYGYSIRELRHGAHPGNLVVTGASSGYPAVVADKIFAMQLYAGPCDPLNPRANTYLRNHNGTGASVREITSSSVGTVGNIVVAGTIYGGPFGGNDVVLQEFQEGTMATVGQYYHYGGSDHDFGESITEVVHAPTTQGYAIAGWTRSPELQPAGTGWALYLLKNNSAKANVCQYHDISPLSAPATWGRICTAISGIDQTDKVITLAFIDPAPWYSYQPCYSPTKPAMPGISDGRGDDVSNALALFSYPNPVRGSEPLTLHYTLTADDVAEIRVMDLFGTTIHASSNAQKKGRITERISTSGWTPGTYFARIIANGHSVTTRVVVVE